MKSFNTSGNDARTREALLWIALTLVAAVIAVGGSFSFFSTDAASAQSASARNFAVRDFDRVKLNGSSTVNVRNGDAFSVRASGPEALLERLTVQVIEGELLIGMKPGTWSGSGHLTIDVTLPKLSAVALNGSGDLNVDQIMGGGASGSVASVTLDGSGDVRVGAVRAGNLTIALDGSGDVNTRSVQTNSVSLTLAGSGDLVTAGTASDVMITVNGSGGVDASALNGQTATIALNGSGDVSARASRSATINANGTGSVKLRGTSGCTIQKSVAAEVSCAP